MKVDLKDLVEFHQPIREEDLVIDVGGYRGDYAQAVFDKFRCRIVVFEPNIGIYEKLIERFKDNPKIVCNPTAIGGEAGLEKLYIREEGSSFFQEWADSNEWKGVVVGKISDFLHFTGIIPKIIKLNCEGAEYDIIRDLDESRYLSRINEILVQFHRIPNWKLLQESAEKKLSENHIKVYDYKWQLWRTSIIQTTGIESGQNIAGELTLQKS